MNTWYINGISRARFLGLSTDQSRQNIERKKQLHEVSEMSENHMVNTWKFCKIYILYHIEHTHTYIYTVYNSIYIYTYIYIHTSFFKHVHIIDVDYIDIALRYVTLNCVYRGTWRWRRSGCDRGTIGGTMSLGKWSRPQKRAHHRWRFVRESYP